MNDAIAGLAGALHLDLNDPAVAWLGKWAVPAFGTNEDTTSNLLAFVLIGAVAVFVAVTWRRRGIAPIYLVAIVAGAVLFVGYVRWQPWNSRLQLPLFILAAPLLGIVAADRRKAATLALAAALVVASTPWLIAGAARPIVGPNSVLTTDRTAGYFVNRPELQAPYEAVVGAIQTAGCTDVGFAERGDEHWEYPLWRLLNPGERTISFRDVDVANETSNLETGTAPCMIVFVDGQFVDGQPQTSGVSRSPWAAEYRGVRYETVLTAAPVYLYRAVGP